MTSWAWGAIEITRLPDPGFGFDLPQDEATTAAVLAADWLHPHWITDEGALRVSSSAILIRTPSARVLVDPWLAFDDQARLAPRLSALRAAGVEPDEVDVVINTHVDGVGANVTGDGTPTFPNARYLLPAAELDGLRARPEAERPLGTDTFADLADSGRLELVTAHDRVVPGVHLEDVPGHSPGHMVVWAESIGHDAVVTGHLFLHPAQILSPEVAQGDLDPMTLLETRRTLLQRCVDEEALLIGPLFADPGGGRVMLTDTGWGLKPD